MWKECSDYDLSHPEFVAVVYKDYGPGQPDRNRAKKYMGYIRMQFIQACDNPKSADNPVNVRWQNDGIDWHPWGYGESSPEGPGVDANHPVHSYDY